MTGEERGDGELELAGVRVAGGGVLGFVVGKWRVSEGIGLRCVPRC